MARRATDNATILVVDDTPGNVKLLLDVLEKHGYRVLAARDAESAVEQARFANPDLVLMDVVMPGSDGFEACRQLKADPDTADIPVIFMTALGDLAHKMRGFELGGADYVVKPFQHEEVLARVRTQLQLRALHDELASANDALETKVRERTTDLERALAEVETLKTRLERENQYLQQEIREQADHRAIVGDSEPMRELMRKVDMVAATDATVLIHGETGTGKELIARALHERSPRSGRALVKLNCAAISAGLVESELFGHLKGAFTGATERRTGRFELADCGTLFLDEVSELPLDTQTKLLRVLQEGEFEPVGSCRTIKVDVRIIAATNRDLQADVDAGRFRADLYYRLNVFPLEMPPLRARKDDVPDLAAHFLERCARKLGRRFLGIEPRSMAALQARPWPGNVRDLQNVIERAAILSRGEWLVVDEPEAGATRAYPPTRGQPAAPPPAAPGVDEASLSLEDIERNHIIAVLRRTRGVIEGPNGAARLLELKPSTARFRIRKLGITRRHYEG